MSENEGLVFEIKTENDLEYLALVVDEQVIDEVFNIYFSLESENEEE